MGDIQSRMREFFRLFRPFTPWTTATILGEVIPDVDWRTCSKRQMAEDYAYGRYGLDTRHVQHLGKAVMDYVSSHVRMLAGQESYAHDATEGNILPSRAGHGGGWQSPAGEGKPAAPGLESRSTGPRKAPASGS